jgi:hypothetical protein
MRGHDTHTLRACGSEEDQYIVVILTRPFVLLSVTRLSEMKPPEYLGRGPSAAVSEIPENVGYRCPLTTFQVVDVFDIIIQCRKTALRPKFDKRVFTVMKKCVSSTSAMNFVRLSCTRNCCCHPGVRVKQRFEKVRWVCVLPHSEGCRSSPFISTSPGPIRASQYTRW